MGDEFINYDYISKYLKSLVHEFSPEFTQMEQYAKINNVPIVHKEVAQLIVVLMKIVKPKTILEIGTAIGYSSILMASNADCEIITIERDFDIIEVARENIKKLGYNDKIKIIGGEAEEVLGCLNNKYDMVFLDGAKGQYSEFLPEIYRLLNKSGVLVTDNVLYKGMVASEEIADKRKCTLIRKLRDYLELLTDKTKFETTVLPLGDGVAISYKL